MLGWFYGKLPKGPQCAVHLMAITKGSGRNADSESAGLGWDLRICVSNRLQVRQMPWVRCPHFEGHQFRAVALNLGCAVESLWKLENCRCLGPVLGISFFFLKIYLFLFLAALGLRCCAQAIL